MAFLQPGSLLFVAVLFVTVCMSCAAPIDISHPDAGLAERKLLSEDYGSPQLNSPIYDNPLLQFSAEKRISSKAPCSYPSPAPVDNGETVVFLDGNNAWEVIVPGGKKPPIVMPPCQVGVCHQALTDERDLVGHHIGPVDYSQPGPAPSPESNDYPQLATWSLNEETCLAHHKCSDPMKFCINGHCVYRSHVDRVNKAAADELDVGAHHINQVKPQSGPAPSPDSYDHPLPATWSLHEVRCIPVCLDRNQVCVKGFCLEPPHVNKGSNAEACLAHHKCSDPMKLCINERCVYRPHVDRVNKAVADELEVQAHHINQVHYPQSGPAQSPDSYNHPLPAAWSLNDIPCILECPDPMQKCVNGYCNIEPPYVDTVIKGFYRGGAVLP